MAINLVQGAIGQLKGPFSQGESISFAGAGVKIGFAIGEKDFMKAGNPNTNNGFAIQINDQLVRMGRTYLYETDNSTEITTVSFPQGAPPSLLIDYVIAGT